MHRTRIVGTEKTRDKCRHASSESQIQEQKKQEETRETSTWLSQEVATKRLALGLKLRLETESFGGWTTWALNKTIIPQNPKSKSTHRAKSLDDDNHNPTMSSTKRRDEMGHTSYDLFGLGFERAAPVKKVDIENHRAWRRCYDSSLCVLADGGRRRSRRRWVGSSLCWGTDPRRGRDT